VERNFAISVPFAAAHLVAGRTSIFLPRRAMKTAPAPAAPVPRRFFRPRTLHARSINSRPATAPAPLWGQKIDYSGYTYSGIIPDRLGTVTLRSLGHLEGRGN
jgi:hypothetical protein